MPTMGTVLTVFVMNYLYALVAA